MNIEILAVYNNLGDYVLEMEKGTGNAEELWEKYAIEPYWGTLCQYAPMDLSDRKPKVITDLLSLKEQIKCLQEINLEQLKAELEGITSRLPNYDEDPIYIAIYPLSDQNESVKKRQGGVVGASTFGNIIINVNPLVAGYMDWIKYVFAHEYHHSVWGNYWFTIHGGELKNQFIESLLIDGEADSFALSLYPHLKPSWLFDLTEEQENMLWNKEYSKLIYENNVDYGKYMFGNSECSIPWCCGYAIGFRIIQSFLAHHQGISFSQLVEMQPKDIFEKSNYRVR